ncbi:hypothetical protein [Dysgonomonas sp. 25]|uniref:hypothetical protein n=1 Tax=Dysgonomonas sp. 25 TaxID=2302933 RepID=UPI0013D842BC|nr:hypothetical protein [Dysgonomonas sp. 25]NDV68582.1 hypothetical protein [Dysgonomonas sp. 25]
MLQITNIVTNKDAQVVKGKITYAIHYIITNGMLTSVQCAISEETDEQFLQIGYIRKENGRINTDFNDDYSMLDHLSVFDELMTEIEADATPVAPAPTKTK